MQPTYERGIVSCLPDMERPCGGPGVVFFALPPASFADPSPTCNY